MKTSIKKIAVSCGNCGSDRSCLVTEGAEHEYKTTTSDIFCVVKCLSCGLYYLNPRPDVSELSTIYPSEYYAYHLKNKNIESENRGSPLYRARRYVYLSRLKKALSALVPSDPLRVLDIGCADGRALNWYRQVEGFNVETYGVDFDGIAVERAREAGHTVFKGVFEESAIEPEFFDLAVATHVIEHVASPREFLKKAYSVLKPSGVCLVETPNIESLDARIFRTKHWGGYHFPRHWVFFSPETITNLCESVGFRVEKVNFHPAPAFWNWTFHSIVKSWDGGKDSAFTKTADSLFPPQEFQRNSLRNLIAVSAFTSFDVLQKLLTGRTSNMSVLLRKPE